LMKSCLGRLVLEKVNAIVAGYVGGAMSWKRGRTRRHATATS
jgi:hypothetical protein